MRHEQHNVILQAVVPASAAIWQPARILPTAVSQCLLRAVEGVLKGYDPLLNLVLDETKEFLRGRAAPSKPCNCDCIGA